MTEAEKKRFCRRCLLKDVPEGETLAQIVGERIAQMDESLRVSEDVRQRRLQQCLSCDRLVNGTCVLCGCYTELRAARKNRRCPDVPPRWLEIMKEE